MGKVYPLVLSWFRCRKEIKRTCSERGENMEPEAIIINGEIRCPICFRKIGELTGNEKIENFKIYCRGRGRQTHGGHCFILNFPKQKKGEVLKV